LKFNEKDTLAFICRCGPPIWRLIQDMTIWTSDVDYNV